MSAAGRSPPAPWAPSLPRPWGTVADLTSAAVVAVVTAVALVTFRDFGITWDESWHLTYGDHILSWFLSLGADTSALCYRIDYMYGGGFDLLGAVARRLSPMSDYETIRLVGALVGVLGLLGAWSLARRLGGPLAGLIAVVLLATTPVYFGHMFNNPKDLPFAVGYVWAMDALVDVVTRMPRVPRRAWVRFAILAGLAMGVRIAGILLLVYLAASVIALAVLRARTTGSLDAGLQTVRRLGIPAAGAMLGAWVVMLSTWPWALLDPIRRPWMALGRMSRFTVHRRTMPFAGEDMLTTEPRWDYLLHYFGLKLPLLVLLLFVAAMVMVAVVGLRRRRRAALPRVTRNVGLVMAAAVFAPPTYAVLVRSVLYDGLRHFLFLVPLVVVVAAVAAVTLPRLWPRARLAVTLALVLGGGAMVARQARDMVRLHPYQYIYFNELIGGLPGAFGKYDTDYYGPSYQEGFRVLAEHLWQTEREEFLDTRYRVTGCIPEFVALEYIEGNLVWVEKRSSDAEFYLGYTRSNCHERHRRRPELLSVTRMDTLLLIIRDLRKGGSADDEDDGEAEDDPGEADNPVEQRRRRARRYFRPQDPPSKEAP